MPDVSLHRTRPLLPLINLILDFRLSVRDFFGPSNPRWLCVRSKLFQQDEQGRHLPDVVALVAGALHPCARGWVHVPRALRGMGRSGSIYDFRVLHLHFFDV